MATPTDPLFSSQWHFPLIGDIETIWDDFTGDGVSVVVYDDGVEYTHADLDDNYDASMHFQYDTDGDGTLETFDPSPISSTDGHGTSCAGIIGAEEGNGAGGVGVAWDVTITGVNYLGDIQFGDGIGGFNQDDVDFILAGLEHAQNFDIMSNSWGQQPVYGDLQSLDALLDTQAFETIAMNGRGGLGTIIVQASGNESSNLNGSGLNVSRHVISVAATEFDGSVAIYSNFGVGMLIAAPASAVTTDLSGDAGYNTDPTAAGDYTDTFGGTSAATPTVAGVVALMLEAEDMLGWRDVQNILAITAAQTGSDIGGPVEGFETSEWATTQSDGGSSWNGGGLSFNVSYGFGMLDAFAAVRMAEVWLTMFGEAQDSSNEEVVTYTYAGPDIVIPVDANALDNTVVVTETFEVTENIQIETIYLTVTIDHNYSEDLAFGLITPDGDTVPVFLNEVGLDDNNTPFDFNDDFLSVGFMDGGWTWTFKITALLGFDSEGFWSFFVEDNFASIDGGVVESFEVEFFGSEISNDDVHVLSRDFLEFTAFDPTRSVLTDTNGGEDWLNFVGVNSDGIGNGDLEISMFGGGAFSVDGVAWGTLQTGAAVFENLIAGDGDDRITGNNSNNEIHGMRGDDVIFGNNGNDTLDGFSGNDRLVGGANNDFMYGGEGNDYLSGGTGNDYAGGGTGNDTIYTGSGDDTIYGNGGTDTIYGGSGNDTVYGGNSADLLIGQDGDDTLEGGSGTDLIIAGADNDFLGGGDNNDTLYAQSGDDTVYGDYGEDLITGNYGDDVIYGGYEDDNIFGGFGEDVISGGFGEDVLRGEGQNDTIYGGTGDDVLSGGTSRDTLFGGDDNDTLNGQTGADVLDGGSGNDFLYGGDAADQLSGGIGNDFLAGGDGNDIIDGGEGNDTLYGNAGNDTIAGGAGDDTMYGNAGDDVFVFSNPSFGNDTIIGWNNGVNLIDFSETVYIFGDFMIEQVGADTVITDTLLGGGTITLTGVDATTIDFNDFLF